ncbi:MHS family MFS transporter [Amycolatopsis rubida]|uniref:MFS transporter, MHS family, proline/betaine transporter n=1 Tax=Amycolatopsis rubida TaxID=112413 RepID=A0A1I5SDG9_9PSEU|nr:MULTISPECIES: MFS transporter [Amycolatopsis]MYW97362.1 MFS transporter [Amycolatopsis rubida]NEC62347.1 MHS family MFS transporter [Amycolatopsis rubida]OAP22810.1 Proline/betaine transporter [Amycolatopsis sp. M39]SFP68780.1 MFS transporter, MHS family, proline/betaine transporter [Amycolatopsis rubida]
MNTEADSGTELTSQTRGQLIRAAVAGNFAEWYDFGVYGVVASSVAAHFFPSGDPTTALLSTYAVFALTYVSRPLGGLVAGWIGDTWGRRASLTITIVLMCTATALIGVLPTYAAMGVGAPALLLACRLLQGLGAGGEYGSAASFLYEHSSPRTRARNISYLVASTFLGVLAAVGVASLTSAVLGNAAFDAWGWRILFLLALPLGAIGIYVRLRVQETPQFRQLAHARGSRNQRATPIRDAFGQQWKTMLVFFFVVAVYALITPTVSSYFTTFLKGPGQMSSSDAYSITLITDGILVVAALAGGRIMERVGLHRLMVGGAAFVAVFSVPAFVIAAQGYVGGIVGGVILATGKGMLAVPAALAIAYMFPTETRVTAGSFAYNATVVLFGGSGPLLGVWLNSQVGSEYVFGVYLSAVALVSVIAASVGRLRLKHPAGSVSTLPAEGDAVAPS